MTRSTFKVLFYLKRQSEKQGKVPVMGRITINGTISQFSCKLNIRPSLWDTQANKAAGKSVEARRINEKLENIKTNIGKQYQRLSDRDAYVSAEKVKEAWQGFGDDCRLLMQTFDAYLQEFKEKRVGKDRKASSLVEYQRQRIRLAWFLEYEYGVQDIPFKELKREFIERYVIYLRTVRGLMSASISSAVKKLHLIAYIASKNGWIPFDPFDGFRVPVTYRERRFLSEKELQAVIDVKLPCYKTGIVRDIFVFCCFTGLSRADVQKLRLADIHTDEQGEQWIIDRRTKTGTQFRVKLLPIAKQLIDKYSRISESCDPIFPVKSDASMNASLGQAAKHAGLSFKPTMHSARHTFATTVTLTQGVPLETVSKMLGHKKITTTQIYAKITNDKIGRDMDALTAKIGSKFRMAQ